MEHYLETLNKCPSCNQNAFVPSLTCVDYTYSKGAFQIMKCSSCALLFTNPRPPESAIGKYYDNPDYVSHTDTQTGLLFRLYSLVKRYTLIRKRLLLERLSSNHTALDYGAGSGDFSAELASKGWAVSAYEPDQGARSLIRQKNHAVETVDSLSQLQDGSKGTITLWHVLEHVHELQTTIKQFHRILPDDGFLIIAVPNHTSYDAGFYREKWAAYDVPRHLYHFNPNSLERLMTSQGFQLSQTKPMWFDAYYVSLLSEKNISNSGLMRTLFGWIRALTVATGSNFFAINRTARCSSVTYIFKKTS